MLEGKRFNKSLLFIVLVVFLLGCQTQVNKISEEKLSMEISSGQPVIETEEEFNDNLDVALEELEEVENV